MSSSSRPPRGKTAAATARPQNASSLAGSRAKLDISGGKSSTSSSSAPRTLNLSNATRPKGSTATSSTSSSQSRTRPEPSTRVRATTTAKGTLPAAASSTTSSHPTSGVPKVRPQPPGTAPEQSDGLQIAAQSCAWAYMASNLEGEHKKATVVARSSLKAVRSALAAEEANIADSHVRYGAEQLLDFYDELSDRKVAEEVAAIITRFTTLEKSVGAVTAMVIRISSLPLDEHIHITQYNDALDITNSLDDECQTLKIQVNALSKAVASNRGRLPPLLGSISTILQGLEDSIVCAKGLVDCCKENYRMSIETLTLV